MGIDLKDKTLGELEHIVLDLGGKKYLGAYIFQFIHIEGAADISQITPLSKAFREQLSAQGYYISRLTVADKLIDEDAAATSCRTKHALESRAEPAPSPSRGCPRHRTAKYLFELSDGHRIETVLLIDGKRRTLCVSTQVGCTMDCRFCATAEIGFERNLTAAEIVDQVNAVARNTGRISNVVYMGMGEPLANYDAVVKSLRILNHPDGKNIGIRHITVSTCGIVPAIRKLACEDVRPRLAVSLNAPTDEIRTRLMPINAKYPIVELMKAMHFYQERTRQRVTFEYVMIKGLNDSTAQAKLLVKVLKGLTCNVNLIEHNPYPRSKHAGSGGERIHRFASVLEDNGIETAVRFKMGRGIRAACGQLGADLLDGGRD
ncbi:MAG: 23S rRNA (adenine(2503)-C(2))-methyltransferase RlmN [Phycisphaerales bacterium]|nr:MAG: 23S rRNA (adenine(2503)-C(2))-methyltransferase RlmN [Phycisphaerales bacterium]